MIGTFDGNIPAVPYPEPSVGVGTRADVGKPRMDLLPWDALEAVARVGTFGASKYTDRNWEEGMAWGRVFGSMMRHAVRYACGEDYDQETGELHAAHIAWNALALTAYMLRGMGAFDDRK